MPSLRDRFKRDSLKGLPKFWQIILLIIPIFVSAFILQRLVLSPKGAAVERLKRELTQARGEIARTNQMLRESKPLTETEAREIRVAKEELESLVENFGTRNQIYDRLTAQARSCNILDIAIDPSYWSAKKEAEEGVEGTLGLGNYRSFMKITFHSDFSDLGCFLQSIPGKKKDILIASLNIRRELPQPAVELILKTFIKETR